MGFLVRVAVASAITLNLCNVQGSTAAASRMPAGTDPQTEFRGVVYETTDAGQTRAEEIFATAEAAVYLPALRRVRWLESGHSVVASGTQSAAGVRTVREFEDDLERDFPRFRSSAHGPYLLKRPVTTDLVNLAARSDSAPAAPLATVFTDSFESGMSNWALSDNMSNLYSWGATACAARTGTHSADALRGGVNTLTCTDAYAPNVTTTMMHKNCEAIQGASQAWLDSYILLATESGADTLGFYYAGADGLGYGYELSGTASTWFHVVLNLKQWNRIGDLTTTSCPALFVQFRSNATTQSGFGARIDDLTIGTAAPGFLTASITATPSSGTVPLTVNFTPAVAGATSAATYQWSFGDAAGTTATTPTASFTYTTAGDYWARLRVDDTGGRAYAHTLIHATSASSCSVTCTASAPGSLAAGSSALFQATATATGCSGTASYSWTFGDGQSSPQQNASHTYTAAGNYNWTLTSSIGGATCTKSGAITVTSGGSKTIRRRVVSPPSGLDVLDSGTIGSSGGTLSGGGFALTVPSGAFGSSATLSLTRTSRARSGGDLSDTFGVQGLPNTLAADLSINVDLDSAPPALAPGESIYVSFGGLAMDRAGVVRSVPFLLPATVNGRAVKATLPKEWASASLASITSRNVSTLGYRPGIFHEAKVTRKAGIGNDHFTIHADPADAAWASTALTTLEAAYQRLIALGFNWGCRQPSGGAFAKIPVYVASLGTGETDPYAEHNSRLDPCGTGRVFTDFIRLNKDYDVSSDTMRASIGHDLFHALQDIYLPVSVLDLNGSLWIKEASSVWFETIFVPGSCPGVMTGDYQFAWRGLFNPTGSAVDGSKLRSIIQNHGYGAAALLKYRTDASPALNDPFVSSLWNGLKAGNSELESLQNALGSGVPDFWTKFSKDYFVGKVCPTSPLFSKSAEIKDASTLAQTFKFSAYPLSSIAFGLNLKGLTITDKTPLPITAAGLTDGQTVFIYATKGGSELAQLTKAVSSYTIPDITAYKGGYIVMTFVDANLPTGDANSQSSTNEVTLAIAPPSASAFSVWVAQVTICGDRNASDLGTVGLFQPKWSGDTFTYTYLHHSTAASGLDRLEEETITGTLSADRKTLVSMAIEIHWKETYPSNYCRNGVSSCTYEVWKSVALANVPAATDWTPALFHYEIKGAGARQKITKFVDRVVSVGKVIYVEGGIIRDDFDCTFPINETKTDSTEITVIVNN